MTDFEKSQGVSNGKYLDGATFAAMVKGGAGELRANVKIVNELNVFPVPDGDTGDNMSMTATGGVNAVNADFADDLGKMSEAISGGMLLGARGNSGVILSQFFAGMSMAFAGHQKADTALVGEALRRGVKQAYSSVMTPTEGTILTVAREGAEYAASEINDDSTLVSIWTDLVGEMGRSLKRTPDLLPQLKEANVVDSGGAGILYIMQGCLKVLSGEDIPEVDVTTDAPTAASVDLSAFGPDSEMTFGYCTELLLQLQTSKVDPESFDVDIIKNFLPTVGDSVVAFKTGTIIKLHVHTLTPEKVLEFCRQYGEFLTVKIENMSVQHSSSDAPAKKPKKSAVDRDFGTVAVASGEGIEKIFLELGVDYIVNGGQTNNPSAQDFVEAFNAVGAKHIFVFPNNGNIVMAAKQAAKLYEDGTVHVIESKDIGMGYAAISAMNFQSGDPELIAETFREAMAPVTTGSVSTAVRDAVLNGVTIENGDYIGFVGKEMLVSCKEMLDAATELLTKMLDEDKFIVTAFFGKDADEDVRTAVEDFVSENFPDVEFYGVDGAQDVYPFIFAVE